MSGLISELITALLDLLDLAIVLDAMFDTALYNHYTYLNAPFC